MKKGLLLFVASALIFTVFSCKNDTKNDTKEDVVSETKTEETDFPKEPRELTSEEKFIQNSVLVKAMSTPELSTFVSFSMNAGLSDMLSKDQGPYTILGPSKKAFVDRSAMLRAYQHVKKKDSLNRIIGSHVIAGNLDSASMVSNIRDGNGSYTATTYTGEKLTFKRDGLEIIVTDSYGNKAKLGKTDIKGDNGIVHVIDNVLVLN